MDDGYGCTLVQVLHPPGDLHRPVHQDVWGDAAAGQRPVQGPTLSVLHYQTEVWLLQTHALQSDDVGVVQHGEESGLLGDTPGGDRDVLVRVLPRRLHRHHLIPPGATVHLPKAAHTDDLLQEELIKADPGRLRYCGGGFVCRRLIGHIVGREDPDPAVKLARPPALVPRHGGIFGEDLHHVPAAQA